jgi:hypothetical protein
MSKNFLQTIGEGGFEPPVPLAWHIEYSGHSQAKMVIPTQGHTLQ